MKKQFFSKKVRFLLIAALVLAVFIGVLVSVTGSSATTGFVQTLLSPVRSLTASASRSVERVYNYAYNYENLQAENTVLQEKIASMEESIRSADTLERENERLRELLGLAEEHGDYKFLSAYVISWDSTNWKSTFTINKGSDNGLSTGMCAVTEFGQVVGLITEVGSNWSTITTILDSSLEISACVSSTGYTGVVEGSYRTGETGNLRLNYLPTDAVMKNGDQVVTTGSTLYPKDLILGYVADAGLDDTGVAKYAVLDAAVDFDNLEQVFLITQYETN
ncbi:MAG: rod shape-determining protein MreC [Oscillospiraceae bacterium]|nr:rod shape-determining protein MreC [Oscillospiraceae bacterium]